MTDRLTHIILKRTRSTLEATLGELQTEAGERICYTLEEPWRDNRPQVSCIPEGTYQYTLRRHGSQTRWQLQDVPKRTAIQIHVGNDLADTTGCILVGLSRSYWQGRPVVLSSLRAIDRLKALLADSGTICVRSA